MKRGNIITGALGDNAFLDGFESYDEIIRRPALEGTNCVPLKWKKGFAEKPIFDISYDLFRKVWHRTLLAAGVREPVRPSGSMRVGAGGRLAGKPDLQ